MPFDAMLFCFGRCGTAPRLRGSEKPRAAESMVKKKKNRTKNRNYSAQCNAMQYEKNAGRAWFGEK